MIWNDTWRLAFRNLRQAKLRTGLTTLGVSIGIASLSGMVSLGVGLQEQVVSQFTRSGIFDSITVFTPRPLAGRGRRRGAQDPNAATTRDPEKPAPVLDDEAIDKLTKLDRVREVYPNLGIPVEIKLGEFTEFTVAAGVPMSARNQGVFRKVRYGEFFSNESENSCLLSLQFAERINEHAPGSLVGQEVVLGYAVAAGGGQSNELPVPGLNRERAERKFRIVGIIEREPGPAMGGIPMSWIMIPLARAREMGTYDATNPQSLLRRLSRRRTYSSVTVKVLKPQDTEDVQKKIRDMGYSTFSINDALQNMRQGFLILDIILALVGSIALTVASLGIVNTMVMSILERTREIGVMKAIGGSDRDVRLIFLLEASTIGLLGGVLGIALGWAAGRAINFGANLYIERQGGPTGDFFWLPWWLIVGSLVFAVAVSLLAGSYPASRAAKLDPIQALRHD